MPQPLIRARRLIRTPHLWRRYAPGLLAAFLLLGLTGSRTPETEPGPGWWTAPRPYDPGWRDSMLALPDSVLVPDSMPGVSRRASVDFMRRMLRSQDSTFAGPDSRHHSDAEMRRAFQRHERDFERLLAMFRADSSLWRIHAPDPAFYTPATALSAERQQRYEQLLVKLGIRMMVREDGEAVLFRATTVHTFDRKGFVWTPQPDGPVVERETTRPSDAFRAYRRLKGNWYIYFQPSS
jgi:hypothetical protein